MERKKIKVNCPSCKNDFDYYSSESRPFCSEKCKMIDLGLWLTESYSIGSKEPLAESDIDKVIENQEKKFDL